MLAGIIRNKDEQAVKDRKKQQSDQREILDAKEKLDISDAVQKEKSGIL